MPCGILVHWPGIKHKSPEVEAWSPNHWTVRENPYIQVFSSFWVNFGIWHKRVVWVHYFACDCPVFPTSFTEKTLVFPLYELCIFVISSVQLLSCVRLFETPWTAVHQASLFFTNSWSLLKLMSVMPSNHLIFCCLLFFSSSIFPSIRVFSNESVLHIRRPKYWNFSFSTSPSSDYSGLISFKMDWFDLLAVQGTLKSLLNTTVQKHQFFGAQLSL